MFLFLACLCSLAQAVTYYVSPSGNDSNNGTSQSQAWRTIGRVQQAMNGLQPGDQVLFERGGIYPGTLDISKSGTAAAPLVFGAYGSGDQPIISGGVPVTNWVQHSGNIWRAALSTAPKYVLVNNEPMTLARFPNTGWLRNVQGSTSHITSPGLNQSSGHWNGAKLIVRTTNYSYESTTVTTSSSGQINFQPIYVNMGNDDWGFFLAGKLSELDMAGEWYHDPVNGQLYLWAPNNANPNSLSVLASIHEKGVVPGWQKSHFRIENLTIQGQTRFGISTEVSNNIVVTNCTIRHCYIGISSSGNNNHYTNNTIQNTFGAGLNAYDTNALIEGNIFSNIAMQPGMGENGWGYWGINATGQGAVIRNNRLTNIGYIGIGVGGNVLVEKNVVINATAILNDGAGISFDSCDGVVVQDNIVMDCFGSLESVATSHNIYYPICFGIYFGNTSIKNTIVQRNTVARCNGAGVHVDHTQVSTGNQVKDNVLFDNNVQLSLSDFSNYNGPGATQPYHVPNFNTIYSGNVLYSLRPEQLCMRQFHVHSPNHVDFGTFTNNRYFHPYEELSIRIQNFQGSGTHTYTLERWQALFNEDAGSTRSPLRLAPYETISELSSDLVTNGNFSAPINNWTIHPSNSQVTIDHTYLDDGALKAFLPNNSVYPSMNIRNPNQIAMQGGQWYRMRLSIQSDIQGIMNAGVKGLSQVSSVNVLGSRDIPFSPERRDLEFYFQSALTDQGLIQLTNHFTHPRYWIDNIQLHRVNVQPVNPAFDHLLFHNEFSVLQSFSVPSGCWSDIMGNTVSGSIDVPPFSSKVIYRVPGLGCSTPDVHTVGMKVMLGGALLPNNSMRAELASQGILPTTEPYSAMGFTPANAGVPVAAAVLQGTGSQAVVDWVLLELRNSGGANSVAAQMAALVKANGDVVAPDGASLITFPVATVGKHLAVHHRNHLAVMTAAPIASNGQVVDLTTSSTTTYGSGARMYQGTLRALWPGDVNGNGMVSYTNTDNDRDEVLVAIGAVVPSQISQGYLLEDVNLDGIVKYTGSSNDRDIILSSVGGVVPTAVRLAQMP
jgi:hypothetical protein